MSIDEIAKNLGRRREAVIFKLANTGVIEMDKAKNLLGGGQTFKRVRTARNKPNRHRNRSNRNGGVRRKRENSKKKIRIHKIIRRKRR